MAKLKVFWCSRCGNLEFTDRVPGSCSECHSRRWEDYSDRASICHTCGLVMFTDKDKERHICDDDRIKSHIEILESMVDDKLPLPPWVTMTIKHKEDNNGDDAKQ